LIELDGLKNKSINLECVVINPLPQIHFVTKMRCNKRKNKVCRRYQSIDFRFYRPNKYGIQRRRCRLQAVQSLVSKQRV